MKTNFLSYRRSNPIGYLIIIPGLLGERIVSEAVHLDVAVGVHLLIAQLLIV